MKTSPVFWRVAVVVALASAVTYVVATKPGRDAVPSAAAPAPMDSHGTVAQTGGIPRLVDLGADKCIPCKAMAPILVELRAEYAVRLQVDFIDVWKDPSAGDPYNIYAIPTQIFFDGNGKGPATRGSFRNRTSSPPGNGSALTSARLAHRRQEAEPSDGHPVHDAVACS